MSQRKVTLEQFPIVNAANMVSGTVTSSISAIKYMDDIGIQFVWSGSPSGNFQVLVSADHDTDYTGNVLAVGNFVPLTVTYWNGSIFVTSQNIPTSLGSPIYLDLALLSAPFIKATYSGSGAGTLTVTITGKAV